MKALLVVDMQNDFMPYGKLPVENGDKIIGKINELMSKFEYVIATQDWHPVGHCSFEMWGEHCVMGSEGADFAKGLNTKLINSIFRKGTRKEMDAYSAFGDNDKKKHSGLMGMLRGVGVTEVYICGVAADICVYSTIIDALEGGFKVKLYREGTMPISAKAFEEQLKELDENDDFELIEG